MQKHIKTAAIAATAMTLAVVGGSQAQQAPSQFPDMTFFITSVGPQGANYGGLEGADRHCQALATKAGAGGKTWRA